MIFTYLFLFGSFFPVVRSVVFQGGCSDVNLLCEQLCITISPETYECSCWNDHVLLSDGITCKLNMTFSDVHTYNAAIYDTDESNSIISFNGNTYAEFPLIDNTYLETNITIEFRISEKRDGILFWGGQFKGDDFISISLIGPNIVFRHDCGEGTIEDLYRGPFLPNEWHNLTVNRKYCDRTEIRADRRTRMLDVTDQFKSYKGIVMDEGIFIGGAPANIQFLDNKAGTSRGFSGCVRKVIVNNQTLLDHSQNINKAVNSKHLDHCGVSSSIADLSQFEEYNIATGTEDDNIEKVDELKHLPEPEFTTKKVETTTPEVIQTNEVLSVAEFDGKSFLNRPAPFDVVDYFELIVHVKPTATSGLIFLWQDEEKYMVLYLDRGFVILQANMGADTTILRSENVISQHQWHRVEAWRSGKGILLKVGRQAWVESALISLGGPVSLSGTLSIGGAPSSSKLSHLSPYEGCIKHIRLNGRSVGLHATRGVRECGSDPCASAGCPHTCASSHQSFVCLCDWPTYGTTCEKVATAQISAMNFHKNSYLELKGENYMNQVTGDSLRLSIEFKVSHSERDTQQIQTLAVAGKNEIEGDFFHLYVDGQGYVQFVMNLGSGPVQLAHPMLIGTERWYTVAVIREKRHVTLSINGESPISTVAPEGSEQLNVYSSIYFGGSPTGNIKREGFDGCIESIDVGTVNIKHPSEADSAINIRECSL